MQIVSPIQILWQMGAIWNGRRISSLHPLLPLIGRIFHIISAYYAPIAVEYASDSHFSTVGIGNQRTK